MRPIILVRSTKRHEEPSARLVSATADVQLRRTRTPGLTHVEPRQRPDLLLELLARGLARRYHET